MSELEQFKGIGKTTAEKLEKAGFNVENISKITLEELTELDINKATAEKILSNFEVKPNENESEDNSSSNNPRLIEHDIKKANKYLKYAFEQSDFYDPENIEESYDRWYSEVIEDKK